MSDQAVPARNPLTPETAFERLQLWYVTKQELSEIKTREILERQDLAKFYFPTPREGTNRMEVSPGYDLKVDYSYTYKVDEAAIDNTTASQIKKLKLPWDDLFVYKPELHMKTYRNLTPEQKAFVDTLLDIKPGTPQMSIVPQAERRNVGDAEPELTATLAVSTEAAPPPPGVTPDGLHIVEDMADAQRGSYYEDGDGDWWLCTVAPGETEDGAGEWEQATDPRPAPPKPTRKPRAKKGA